MLRSFLLYLSEREGLKNFLSRRALGRRLAARFIAGEDLQGAVRAVRAINQEGFDVTLDYLGESVHAPEAAGEACQSYLNLLDTIAAEKLRANISIKLTQLGLAIDEGLAQQHLATLCRRAAGQKNFIRIDMESSAYTESTLRVFERAAAPREALGVVIQSYLRRSEKDVASLIESGARVRLVKGAYQEPPDLAYPDKHDVDRYFVKLMESLLASGGYHAIATHDEKMIAATLTFVERNGIGPERFEFQMLYGIRRQLQRDLLRRGFRVRIYVPYGKQWYAYFMRRLAERPANLFFLVRNFLRG